jgi:hypothetical protein
MPLLPRPSIPTLPPETYDGVARFVIEIKIALVRGQAQAQVTPPLGLTFDNPIINKLVSRHVSLTSSLLAYLSFCE